MIDVWNDGVLGSLPVKMGEQQKNVRQPFRAEIANLLINRIGSNLLPMIVAATLSLAMGLTAN
jgi:hypothetical protein